MSHKLSFVLFSRIFDVRFSLVSSNKKTQKFLFCMPHRIFACFTKFRKTNFQKLIWRSEGRSSTLCFTKNVKWEKKNPLFAALLRKPPKKGKKKTPKLPNQSGKKKFLCVFFCVFLCFSVIMIKICYTNQHINFVRFSQKYKWARFKCWNQRTKCVFFKKISIVYRSMKHTHFEQLRYFLCQDCIAKKQQLCFIDLPNSHHYLQKKWSFSQNKYSLFALKSWWKTMIWTKSHK